MMTDEATRRECLDPEELTLDFCDTGRALTMLMVVQNDPIVPPGLIVEILQEKGLPFRLIRTYAEDHSFDLTEGCGVIVLGGTMSVQDTARFPFLRELKHQIREVVQRGIPYLGICLGGQLLAEVLGAEVHLQKRGEKGCHQIELTEQGDRDPIFSGMPKRFSSFQWHGDSFDLPPEAVHLARTGTCPYQAFRWGKTAYGIQFHPEVTREIVSAWTYDVDEGENVLSGFTESEEAYRSAALVFINNFLNIARR